MPKKNLVSSDEFNRRRGVTVKDKSVRYNEPKTLGSRAFLPILLAVIFIIGLAIYIAAKVMPVL